MAIYRDRLPEAFEALASGRRIATEIRDGRQLAVFAETIAWAHLLACDGAAALESFRESSAVDGGPADGHILARMMSNMTPQAAGDVLEGVTAFVAAVNARMAGRWRMLARAAGTDPALHRACEDFERRMRRGNRSTVDMLAGRGVLRTDRPADELGDLRCCSCTRKTTVGSSSRPVGVSSDTPIGCGAPPWSCCCPMVRPDAGQRSMAPVRRAGAGEGSS